MRIAFFSMQRYERESFTRANVAIQHDLCFLEPRLSAETARLADGFPVVCVFVNDDVDRTCLEALARGGTKLLATRTAGFNHIDIAAATELNLPVVRVPEYSPHAVAEHAVGLILLLNRKLHRAYNRVREMDFSLDGLVGFDLVGKTVGVIGTGKIGSVFARIMHGFGCQIVAFDVRENAELKNAIPVRYQSLDETLSQADIVALHCPLTPGTMHMLNAERFGKMKKGAMLINTSRGGLVETRALIEALKSGQIGAAGLDVYEEEAGVFFHDLSERGVQDDVLARLLTFPNVVVTAHQGFLTREALQGIAETTLASVTEFERGQKLSHQVCL